VSSRCDDRKAIRARRRGLAAALLLIPLGLAAPAAVGDEPGGGDRLAWTLRSRVEAPGTGGQHRVVERKAAWDPRRTAIIVCDMWDLHHCLNATRRGAEMAPRMDRVLRAARGRGVLVIHAPSGCMAAYADHPARKRAQATPRSRSLPPDIGTWCYQIPSEERGTYPIDQTDGGEDDDPAEHDRWAAKLAALGRNPRAPWKAQADALTIDPDADLISDDGAEIWSALEARGIDRVILLGVHTNMCVLGRPFGLRQMARNGKDVVLMRDMTDTMYNPRRAPFVSHFTGTDLIVEHIEKYVCPTVTSDGLLGGEPFRFRDDRRPHVAFLIAEDEYRTERTLPEFAARELARDFRISLVFGDEEDGLPGLGVLDEADLAVVSVRRRILPAAQMAAIRRFVARGKPLIGIRTASHAFAPRGNGPIPDGSGSWPEFDAEVLGGHYHGHHGEGPTARIEGSGALGHPILAGVDVARLVGHGSLYRVRPLAGSATSLLMGAIPGQDPEPVAWTNLGPSGGRVFTTSLGHPDDFQEPEFRRLLRNAADWAVGREVPTSKTADATPDAPRLSTPDPPPGGCR
jgi:nicotinamidase-related amidase/type 1 glutamine amidotransferase